MSCRRPSGFIFPETLLRDFPGFAFGFFVVLATLFFLALTSFRGLTLRAIGSLTACAAPPLFLGNTALFCFAYARVGKRMSTRGTLFLGQGPQHNAGRLWLRFSRRQASTARATRFSDRCFLRFGCRRGLGLGLAWPADNTTFDLFNDNLLAAPVAETLAYYACLGAWLERQRFAGDAEFFLAGVFSLAHSVPFP